MSIINFISLLAGPAIATLLAVKFREKLNSKDATILIVSFLIGLICVVPSLVIKHTAAELGFDDTVRSLFGKIGFGTFTAFVDEFNKYIVIIAFAYRKKEFDEPLAGILVAIMINMGFITADNAWHAMDIDSDDRYTHTWRMLTAIPLNMAFAIMVGFYSGLSKYGMDSDDLSSFSLRIRGLVTATFFHGFYNFFLFMEEYQSLTVLITIGIILLLIQIGLNLMRAFRLHTRLMYSRKKRSRNGMVEL